MALLWNRRGKTGWKWYKEAHMSRIHLTLFYGNISILTFAIFFQLLKSWNTWVFTHTEEKIVFTFVFSASIWFWLQDFATLFKYLDFFQWMSLPNTRLLSLSLIHSLFLSMGDVMQDWTWPYTNTNIRRPLTLTLLGAAAGGQAGRAAWLAVVLHAGVEGGVNQAGLVWQQGHGGGGGAIVGERGNSELWCAVSAFALLRAPLPVRREAIVRRPFTPAGRGQRSVTLNSLLSDIKVRLEVLVKWWH